MRHGGRSASVEEYLEEMYRFELEGREIGTKMLAKRLGIKMPSVSGMLSKLKKGGFIEYRVRGNIMLTKRGRTVGRKIYSRFIRLKFILTGLGTRKTETEREACVLEHAISERLMGLIERRIAER